MASRFFEKTSSYTPSQERELKQFDSEGLEIERKQREEHQSKTPVGKLKKIGGTIGRGLVAGARFVGTKIYKNRGKIKRAVRGAVRFEAKAIKSAYSKPKSGAGFAGLKGYSKNPLNMASSLFKMKSFTETRKFAFLNLKEKSLFYRGRDEGIRFSLGVLKTNK